MNEVEDSSWRPGTIAIPSAANATLVVARRALDACVALSAQAPTQTPERFVAAGLVRIAGRARRVERAPRHRLTPPSGRAGSAPRLPARHHVRRRGGQQLGHRHLRRGAARRELRARSRRAARGSRRRPPSHLPRPRSATSPRPRRHARREVLDPPGPHGPAEARLRALPRRRAPLRDRSSRPRASLHQAGRGRARPRHARARPGGRVASRSCTATWEVASGCRRASAR